MKKLIFLLPIFALAQTNLSTPITILPKSDGSAAGILRLRDLAVTPHYINFQTVAALGVDVTYSIDQLGFVNLPSHGLIVAPNPANTFGAYQIFRPLTYNPHLGSTCTDQWGNVVTQPLPVTGDSFGANDILLWNSTSPVMPSSGSCGTALPVNGGNGLNTNAYLYARAGLATESPYYNSVQSLLGGMYAMTGFTTFGVVMLGQNSTPGTLLTCTDPFSSGVNNCPYQPGGAYKSIPFGGLAHISGSTYSYLNSTTSVWHNIDLSTVGTGVSSLNSLTGGLSLTGTYLTVTPSGSAINLALPQSIATTAMPSFVSVQSTSTTSALSFSTANGNFQVDGLGNISIAGTGSVIAINGSAGGLNITNDTNGASIQSVGGINLNLGAAATTGFTIHQYSGASVDAFDLINSLSTTIFKIGSLGTVTAPGFVGTNTTTNNIFQNAAGTFAVTGAADTTVHNLTVNGSCTGCFTGVTALYGTTNEIIASASTGAVTLSTPQAIDTGASPTFNALTATTQFRSMSTTSALSFSTNNGNFQVDGLGNISVAGTGSVISIQGSAGGLNVTNDTSSISIQTIGGVKASQGYNVGTYGGSTTQVINSSGQWVGSAIYSAGTNIGISSGTISTSATPSFTSVQTTSTTGTLAFSTANGNFQVDGLGNISIAGTGSVIAIQGSAGGLNVTNDTSSISIQTIGGVKASQGYNVGTYGGSTTQVIDSSGVWKGSNSVIASGYSPSTGVVTLIGGTNITSITQSGSSITINAGATGAGGSNTQVQYNSSGAFAGSGNFAWDATNQVLNVTGKTVGGLYVSALNVNVGYIYSQGGFNSDSMATNVLNATGGGVDVKWLLARESLTWVQLASAPTAATSGSARIYAKNDGHLYYSAYPSGYVQLDGGVSQWTTGSGGIYYNGGNVGIGSSLINTLSVMAPSGTPTTVSATSIVDFASKYAYMFNAFVLNNPNAGSPNKTLFLMGGEGVYNNSGALGGYDFYINDNAWGGSPIYIPGGTGRVIIGNPTAAWTSGSSYLGDGSDSSLQVTGSLSVTGAIRFPNYAKTVTNVLYMASDINHNTSVYVDNLNGLNQTYDIYLRPGVGSGSTNPRAVVIGAGTGEFLLPGADNKASIGGTVYGASLLRWTKAWLYGADVAGKVQINSNATGNTGLVVQGFSGQTANLQEWQNSAGAAITSIGSAGTVSAPGFNMNSTGGYYANGLAGVTSTTCTQWTYGICTHN